MLLLIDAGNTRIKWALVSMTAQKLEDLGRWQIGGAVSTDSVTGLMADWRGLTVKRVLISNVAGKDVLNKLEHVLREAFGPVALEWFVSVPALNGLRNGYRHPTQLGCDRFASAIGAATLFPHRRLIVATCGTATTIDAITADGLFVGGMILPGLGLMASALEKNTAQLPRVAEADTSKVFADNTEEAIVSGCIAAQVGAIEHAVAAHHVDGEAVICVLSGGAASFLAPSLTLPHERVDNLVLIGLHVVAMTQAERESC